MHNLVEQHRSQFASVVESAKLELGAIRTGRANPLLVEQVQVEAYGVRTPLKQLATISVPEASSLLIEPWDTSLLKEVERALVEARLGLTPTTVSQAIRITVAPLTAETRSELIRHVNAKIEQFKMRLRSLRDKVREEIGKAEKAKVITQDDRYQCYDHLDTLTKEHTEKLKVFAERKIQEINTI